MFCKLLHRLRHPLLLMAVLGSFSGVLSARPTPQPLTPVTVQLNWRHQFEFAAFYAAIEQGYYKKAGLQVSLIEGGPANNSVTEVLDGKAWFGVSSSALMLDHSQGKPLLALGVFMQHSAIAILGSRERGINSVFDLAGKTLSCSPHACEEAKAYLIMSGVDLRTVRFVEHTDPNALKRLETFDATEVYWTNDGYRIQDKLDRYILMMPRSSGIDVYGNVLFTTKAIADKWPELVRKFRDATFKGLRYAQEHPKELADLIVARYNSQGKSAEHLLWEALKLNELIRPDLVEPGYMSQGRWMHIRDVFANAGFLPADYDFQTLLHDPVELSIPKWLYALLIGLVVLISVSSAFLVRLNWLNKKLVAEVQLRYNAEDNLRRENQRFKSFVDRAYTLIAHELRTPLSVIKLRLDILRLKKEEDNGARRADIDAIVSATHRLEELFQRKLKDVFDVAEQPIERKSVNISEAVKVIASEFQSLQPCSIAFGVLTEGAAVSVAPSMIKTLLFNLLDNARKYSPKDADIQIDITKDNDQLEVSVRNLMAFEPPDNLTSLLAKFERGNAVARVPGSGVGLYLAQLIVEAHGGTITLGIDAERRFTTSFSLPINPDAHASF